MKNTQRVIRALMVMTAAPSFVDYEEAQAWLQQKTKEHGNLKRFTSTQEYRDVHPEIDRLYKEMKQTSSEKRIKQMNEYGIQFGDRVNYSYLNLFDASGTTVLSGTVFNKNGIPYVRLDSPTMDGRKEVRWIGNFEKL